MGSSDVFFIALVAFLVLSLVTWAISRATVKEPTIPVPRPTLDADTIRRVTDLVAADKRIEAIKLLRQQTGLGLRDSKEWVDSWDARSAAAGAPTSAAAVADPAVLDELAIGTRAVRSASGDIHAVKFVREQTGWGLKDAKDYVDRLG